MKYLIFFSLFHLGLFSQDNKKYENKDGEVSHNFYCWNKFIIWLIIDIPVKTNIFQLNHGCKISAKAAYYDDTGWLICYR